MRSPDRVPATLVLFPEDFGRKGLNQRALLPGIERQARFATGLFEEGDVVPIALGWHLQREEAALSAMLISSP